MQHHSTIRVLTTEGLQFIPLDSDDASVVGRHWNAVRNYLDYGRDTLRQFQGHVVAGYELETDPARIEALAIRGEVRFDSIYDEGL